MFNGGKVAPNLSVTGVSEVGRTGNAGGGAKLGCLLAFASETSAIEHTSEANTNMPLSG